MKVRPIYRRRRNTSTIVGLLVCVLLAAIAGGFWIVEKQADKASIQNGRELAELLCARCHALSAQDKSPNPSAPPFRTLLARLTIEGIEDELTEGISLGHQPMPEWQFSGQQIYDLTSFIASIRE